MKKIYVGNLPFSATEEEIEELFAQYGEVVSVKLISDREDRASSRLRLRGDGRRWC